MPNQWGDRGNYGIFNYPGGNPWGMLVRMASLFMLRSR